MINSENQKYDYDQAIVIGRFQPFHRGHITLIEKALEIAPLVKVLVGSPNRPRDIKNPFTLEERSDMIYEHLPLAGLSITGEQLGMVYGLEDAMYNDQEWMASVQNIVDEHPDSPKVAIVGHKKDDSSYYLDLFPQYDLVEVEQKTVLDATTIREKMWKEDYSLFRDVPEQTADFLETFMNTSEFKKLRKEYAFIENYKSQWESAPYPPTFVTVDAIVICKGHVLVVKRKASPGKGLIAFPGGFLKIDKSARESVIDELLEETKINVPEKVLRSSIVDEQLFDAPKRSLRGRTVTQAFVFDLKESRNLPRVIGSDDAEKAYWITLSEFYRNGNKLFEDHHSMGRYMLGKM